MCHFPMLTIPKKLIYYVIGNNWLVTFVQSFALIINNNFLIVNTSPRFPRTEIYAHILLKMHNSSYLWQFTLQKEGGVHYRHFEGCCKGMWRFCFYSIPRFR